jgi:DNA polymerase III subunit gamma/tau
MARILARALLCESSVGGEPCDKCPSCVSFLEDRSECFFEVDAATNSGKDSIKRITEDAQFGSFSGNRKIYLLDECQELSKQAFDALLKPLEDNIRGTEDKQLVCIFCTTEPEKIRAPVLSRCAPLFKIRVNTPAEIASRLEFVSKNEGLEYDPQVLPLIAEVCECHVRDALKGLEGVSMLGPVNRENVETYLHLDANALFLDLLEAIGKDQSLLWSTVEKLLEKVSAGSAYKRMADVCMLAYKLFSFGSASVPSYWDRDRLLEIGNRHKEFLLVCAQKFAERPARVSSSILSLDLATLHAQSQGITFTSSPLISRDTVPMTPQPPENPGASSSLFEKSESSDRSVESDNGVISDGEASNTFSLEAPSVQDSGSVKSSKPFVTSMGVHINPLAQNNQHQASSSSSNVSSSSISGSSFTSVEFSKILELRVQELVEERSSARRSRPDNLGSS